MLLEIRQFWWEVSCNLPMERRQYCRGCSHLVSSYHNDPVIYRPIHPGFIFVIMNHLFSMLKEYIFYMASLTQEECLRSLS